jgi:hypothetical protein
VEFVSPADLVWIFQQELIRLGHPRANNAVAIVPDKVAGWTALTAPSTRAKYPKLTQLVQKTQKSLRAQYRLKPD